MTVPGGQFWCLGYSVDNYGDADRSSEPESVAHEKGSLRASRSPRKRGLRFPNSPPAKKRKLKRDFTDTNLGENAVCPFAIGGFEDFEDFDAFEPDGRNVRADTVGFNSGAYGTSNESSLSAYNNYDAFGAGGFESGGFSICGYGASTEHAALTKPTAYDEHDRFGPGNYAPSVTSAQNDSPYPSSLNYAAPLSSSAYGVYREPDPPGPFTSSYQPRANQPNTPNNPHINYRASLPLSHGIYDGTRRAALDDAAWTDYETFRAIQPCVPPNPATLHEDFPNSKWEWDTASN